MNLILKHKHFLSFGGTGRVYEQLYEMQALVKILKKKDFSGKMIIQEKYKGHEVTKQKIIETRYSNTKSDETTTIFGEYVSIHLLTQKP
jgi:hypothetical protein